MFVKFVIASIRSQYHFLVVQRSKKSPSHRKQVSAKGTPFPPNYSHCVRLLVSTGLYLYVNDFLITFASERLSNIGYHVGAWQMPPVLENPFQGGGGVDFPDPNELRRFSQTCVCLCSILCHNSEVTRMRNGA